MVHHTVDDNSYDNGRSVVPRAYDQTGTDLEVVYDPRVSSYGTRVVPHNAFPEEPVEKPVKVPTETSVEEPVVYLIETSVEEPVEVLIEIPVGAPFEGPDEGPVEIYVEVPQGMTLEVLPDVVHVEPPVEEPLQAPAEVVAEAAVEASPQVEREVFADKKPGAHTATLAESFDEDSPDEPQTSHLPLPSVVPVEAKAIDEIPADGANETVLIGKDLPESDLLSEEVARGEESSDDDEGKNTMLLTDTDLPQVDMPSGDNAMRGTTGREVQKVEEPFEEVGPSVERLSDDLPGLETLDAAGGAEGVRVQGVAVHEGMTDEDTSSLNIFRKAETISGIPEEVAIQGVLSKEASGEEAPSTGTSPQDAEGTTAKNTKAIDVNITEKETTGAAVLLPEGNTNGSTDSKTVETEEDSDDADTGTGAPPEEPIETTFDDLTSKEEPDNETTAIVIMGFTSHEASDDNKNLIEDSSDPDTRIVDLVDSMTEVKTQHMANSSAVEAPVGAVGKTAVQIPVERMTDTVDAPSVHTSPGVGTPDTEGLDVVVAVRPTGEELPEDGVLHIEDTPEADVHSDDNESPVPRLSTRPHPSSHPPAVPSVLRTSYKYYPGIPVDKQKRKLPRGFLVPSHV